MRATSIIIVGPADGFRAFRFPNLSVEKDDSYALSGSEMDLQEAGVAFKISRIRSLRSGTGIRFAVYKQTYEPNLRRGGHSFGVIIEFSESMAALDSVYEVMSGLMLLVEEQCITEGKFCDLKGFTTFVSNYLPSKLGADVANAFGRLRDSEQRALPFVPSAKLPNDSYFKELDGKNIEESLLPLWSWLLHSAGGCLIVSLLAASKGQATQGSSCPELPNIEKINREAAYILVDQLEFALIDLERKDAEIRSFGAEKTKLNLMVREREESARKLEGVVEGLQRQQAERSVRRQAVLAESDLTAIRQIVADAVRANSRPSQPQPVVEVPVGDDYSQIVLWVLCAILGVAVSFGLIYFLFFK